MSWGCHMSLYFDLVINCDLREDVPADVIEGLRCLTSKDYEPKTKPQLIYRKWGFDNLWDDLYDKHFLAPDPEHEVVSNFQRKHRLTIPLEGNREVHRYCLQYCGRNLHDDGFYELHLPFVAWLASVAYEDYIGYYKETENSGLLHQFNVKNGEIVGWSSKDQSS